MRSLVVQLCRPVKRAKFLMNTGVIFLDMIIVCRRLVFAVTIIKRGLDDETRMKSDKR